MRLHPIMIALLFITLGLWVALHESCVYAAEDAMKGMPVLPGGQCQTPPHPTWTPQEKWVWERVCVGEIANFNEAEGYGGLLDPKMSKGWPTNRIVRPVFLEAILLYEPYRSSLTRKGVHIMGVWFKTPLDLSYATLNHPLRLEASLLDSDVNLNDLRTPHFISFQGSKFIGQLYMSSLQAGSTLFLRLGEFAAVTLYGAHIKGQLSMAGARFTGLLNMENLHVGDSLFMNGGQFSKVMLRGARVEDQLNMIGSAFTDSLFMLELQIGGSLFMREGAQFAEVILRGAHIKGLIDMSSALFNAPVYLDNLRVDQGLLTYGGTTYLRDVVLRGSYIGGQLGIVGSIIKGTLDMDSVRVGGGLLLRGGSKFAAVVLQNAHVEGQIEMGGSSFDGEVTLIGAEVGRLVDMQGAKFSGPLKMRRLRVASSLFMHGGAQFAEVDLYDARVGGQLDMSGATFTGNVFLASAHIESHLAMIGSSYAGVVNLNAIRVGTLLALTSGRFAALDLQGAQVGFLEMSDATFSGEVLLKGARIQSQVKMNRSIFTNKLDMDGIRIAQDIHTSRGSKFTEVWFRGAHIGDQLNMAGSTFAGNLDMSGVQVEGDLVMRNIAWDGRGNVPQWINLSLADLGGGLFLSGALIPSLDLSGSRIRRGFWLGQDSPPISWQQGAKLTLHNAEVGALQDQPTAWPDDLELDGFTYAFLTEPTATREASWYKGWLAKQTHYSPQPYVQLAGVFEKTGHRDKAKEIRYAGKERERNQTTGLSWLWLTGLKWTIGYGYYYYCALLWTGLWTFFGMMFLLGSWMFKPYPTSRWPSDSRHWSYNILNSFFFSFDMLLPIINLDKHHEAEIFNDRTHNIVQCYFYVHQIVGYLLAFFLVAGLSGLAK
jgi:uncharacterized protein YjbI with pentapeptide repeats